MERPICMRTPMHFDERDVYVEVLGQVGIWGGSGNASSELFWENVLKFDGGVCCKRGLGVWLYSHEL